jgi:hypothetical protein
LQIYSLKKVEASAGRNMGPHFCDFIRDRLST